MNEVKSASGGQKIITKTVIDKLISDLISNYEIIAPVKEENLILFKTIKKSEEILWNFANSLKPAKYVIEIAGGEAENHGIKPGGSIDLK